MDFDNSSVTTVDGVFMHCIVLVLLAAHMVCERARVCSSIA